MNLLWDLYWPMIIAALVVGVIAGALAFRRRGRVLAITAGIAVVLVVAWAWNGPAGAAERFASFAERESRQALLNYEMVQVRAVVERDPLSRTVILSGPADEFQRGELVRILDTVPGVASVRWTDSPRGFTLPLLVEAELAALLGFGVGLVLSYLLELRRRSRAQWRW